MKLHPVLLQLLAISPVLWWFGKRLDDGNDEALGLLTLGLALVLAWRDRRSLHTSPCARIIGAVLVLLSDRCWHSAHCGRRRRRTVHERITSGRDGSAWTDVSAWYWAALGHPLNGPWQAETVIAQSFRQPANLNATGIL